VCVCVSMQNYWSKIDVTCVTVPLEIVRFWSDLTSTVDIERKLCITWKLLMRIFMQFYVVMCLTWFCKLNKSGCIGPWPLTSTAVCYFDLSYVAKNFCQCRVIPHHQSMLSVWDIYLKACALIWHKLANRWTCR